MSDDVICLSSGDEDEPCRSEKDIKKEISQKKLKKNTVTPPCKKRRIELVTLSSKEDDRFSASSSQNITSDDDVIQCTVFSEFLDICSKLDESPNMKFIIQKKLKKIYSRLIPEYRDSEEFVTFIDRKATELKFNPTYKYLHIKEIVNELNTHRSDKVDPASKEKRQFIKRLEKAEKLILKNIKRLEEEEVDWDDEEDSAYLKLDKYRARCLKIHKKLQELRGNKSEDRRKITYTGTQFPAFNKTIEKFINRTNELPDYLDIYDLLKMTYAQENIKIKEQELNLEAKSIFINVGEKMQKRRKLETWESIHSFLEEGHKDPADENAELRSTLEESRKRCLKEVNQVIDAFAEKNLRTENAAEETAQPNTQDKKKQRKEKEENGIQNDKKESLREELENEKCENNCSDESDDDDDDDDGGGGGGDDDEEDEIEGTRGKESVEDILRDMGEEIKRTKKVIDLSISPPSPDRHNSRTLIQINSVSDSDEDLNRKNHCETELNNDNISDCSTVVYEEMVSDRISNADIKTEREELDVEETSQINRSKIVINNSSLSSLQNKDKIPEIILLE